MADIVKLDIMSDGSVSVDGTRITPNKMYGIQSVVKSVSVSKESIVKALEIEKEIRAKAIDEFVTAYYNYCEEKYGRFADDEICDMQVVAEKLKGGAI